MQLGTPDICDQYREKLQVFPPVFKSYGGCKSVAAQIETLKIYQDNAMFWEVLRQPGLGRVLFVDAGADYSAVMGDKMAVIAVENGWYGMVINGYIRDTAIIKTLPLAVWALGSCPMKGTMVSEAKLAVNLSFQSINIEPGMYVYADEDGVLLSQEAFTEFDDIFNQQHRLISKN